MGQIFDESTTAQIDARLYRDVLAHEEKIEKYCIIAAIILILIFRGWIGYWLKFGLPIPSAIEIKPINVMEEPIQTDYTEELKQQKIFTYKTLINKNTMELTPQAHYVLSARVVEHNHDVMFRGKNFGSAALYDLGATWGDLSNPQYFKDEDIRVYTYKFDATESRKMYWQWSYNLQDKSDYINSHISHNHILPANNNIMAAMLKLKLYDKVKLEGELVDVKYYKQKYGTPVTLYTSLSRTDIDISSRGSGADEIFYVTKVQIGKFVYK